MGYKTKIQLIERKDHKSDQWYAFFPKALAEALNFKKGENIEWEIEELNILKMIRIDYKKK